jgi:hypothetical protein
LDSVRTPARRVMLGIQFAFALPNELHMMCHYNH